MCRLCRARRAEALGRKQVAENVRKTCTHLGMPDLRGVDPCRIFRWAEPALLQPCGPSYATGCPTPKAKQRNPKKLQTKAKGLRPRMGFDALTSPAQELSESKDCFERGGGAGGGGGGVVVARLARARASGSRGSRKSGGNLRSCQHQEATAIRKHRPKSRNANGTPQRCQDFVGTRLIFESN